MAGDWIKMRMDLPEDPAVYKIASLTKLDRLSVCGRLYAFWSWADKHAVDGRVDGASSLVVDDVTRCDGFAAALVAVKWLSVEEDAIEIPKHERHNGESAKERTLKNDRQARWRGKKATEGAETGAPNVDAPPSTNPSTREEKRREEKEEAKPRKARPHKILRTLTEYLADCKADGKKPVPEGHPIRAYCADAGITDEMLQIAWIKFRDKRTGDGADAGKRQKDWPGTFANCIRDRWDRLWMVNEQGAANWTQNGLQEKRVLDTKARQQEAEHAPA